ncbi:MAG: YHS domain-containing (seleno)protein [Parvularculales bacterium]
MTPVRMAYLFVSIAVLAAGLAVSLTPDIGVSGGINTKDHVAVEGADVVAYFTQGKVTTGSKAYEYVWHGATWRFASEENRDVFAAHPEKYAPQYGGYCAYAISRGYTAPIDPEAWTIVDGNLYLNYSKGVRKEWEQDVSGNIVLGDKNWHGIYSELSEE